MYFLQIPTVKDITGAASLVETWPFWVVLFIILSAVIVVGVFIIRGYQRQQESLNALMAKLAEKSDESVIPLAAALQTLSTTMNNINNRQTSHDEQIDDIEEKIDDVQKKQTNAFEKLTETLESQIQVSQATVKSYQTLEENFVQSYDSTSKFIGLSAAEIKKNSDANTSAIIAEVHRVPSSADIRKELEPSFLQIREDIAKLIPPDLAKEVVERLKPDVADMVDKALMKCYEESAKKDAELRNVTDTLDDTQSKLTEAQRARVTAIIPEHPEPPEPGNRAPIPGDFEPQVKLPPTGTEGL